MPSPFNITASEEEFKKMFPALKFGPGGNGITAGLPPVLPAVLAKRNRIVISKQKI
jgi:hypothetical protein